VKLARGTYQPARDARTQEVVVAGLPPQMPEYLLVEEYPEAEAIWQEEVGRAMAAGVTELDSSLFARYCVLEAMARVGFNEAMKGNGPPPPAAYITELRRIAELLGLAGRKSRVGKVADGATGRANPFAGNGRRSA
jgi:hypothetical protein